MGYFWKNGSVVEEMGESVLEIYRTYSLRIDSYNFQQKQHTKFEP